MRIDTPTKQHVHSYKEEKDFKVKRGLVLGSVYSCVKCGHMVISGYPSVHRKIVIIKSKPLWLKTLMQEEIVLHAVVVLIYGAILAAILFGMLK